MVFYQECIQYTINMKKKIKKKDGKAVLTKALILDYTLGLKAIPEILI